MKRLRMNVEDLRKKLLEQVERVEKLSEEQRNILKERIKSATPEQLEAFIKQSQNAEECFFCQIVSGKVETIKIYEDKEILAFLDIYPANLGHIIVIPKKHFQFIQEIPDNLLNKLFLFVKTIEPVLVEVVKAKGIAIYIGQGQAAGQMIPHFSINIIPDVNFQWDKKKVKREELEKIAETLRDKAGKIVRKKLEAEKLKEEKKTKKEEEKEAEKIFKHVKQRIP